jgi:hypothetical protein
MPLSPACGWPAAAKIQKSNEVIASYEANDCFARGLELAMNDLGYKRICVSASKGPVINVPN